MPTPTFKLLLNALRLGQPQDPQAAIFALVEALSAQEDVIDELRRRLQVVQSATQILETKAARLEMDLETLRSQSGTNEQSPADAAPASMHESSRHPSQRPQSLAAAQQQHAAQQQQQQQLHAAQLQKQHAAQYAAQQLHQQQLAAQFIHSQQAHRALNETQEAPAAQQQPQPQQQQSASRSASARPPPRIPSDRPGPIEHGSVQQGSMPQAQPPTFPKAAPLPREPLLSEESSGDDFRVETMVVHKKDLEFLKNPDAPFRLPPPGQRAAPDRGSIPGAPWARGALQAEKGKAQQSAAQPPLMDEFTAEAAPQQSFREEGDDETYRDGGGISSLAAALGLAADDPRIQKLRSGRLEPQSEPQEARRSDSVPPPPKR